MVEADELHAFSDVALRAVSLQLHSLASCLNAEAKYLAWLRTLALLSISLNILNNHLYELILDLLPLAVWPEEELVSLLDHPSLLHPEGHHPDALDQEDLVDVVLNWVVLGLNHLVLLVSTLGGCRQIGASWL